MLLALPSTSSPLLFDATMIFASQDLCAGHDGRLPACVNRFHTMGDKLIIDEGYGRLCEC